MAKNIRRQLKRLKQARTRTRIGYTLYLCAILCACVGLPLFVNSVSGAEAYLIPIGASVFLWIIASDVADVPDERRE